MRCQYTTLDGFLYAAQFSWITVAMSMERNAREIADFFEV